MGIEMQKEWMATLDSRTRHSHRRLDGETVEYDSEFSNGCRYPGDPKGKPAEVYNCRCTMVARVKGIREAPGEHPKRMTYGEWEAQKRGKSAGDKGYETPDGTPVLMGEIDFSDENAVIGRLNMAEKKLSDYEYEVNYSVTKDGKVWRVSGNEGSVHPASIPSDLRGSYSYHNHPPMQTNYSFSAEDVAFFFEIGEAYAKASDDIFEYVMRRTEKTIEKSSQEVYHRFKEILSNEVMEMKWMGSIDPDLDGYHETMKILSKELGFDYERTEKR